jgi:superfamily II DNA/RNA helicase
VRLIKTIRKKNPAVQLLLFSATYNDKIKGFATRIAPNANQVCTCTRGGQAAPARLDMWPAAMYAQQRLVHCASLHLAHVQQSVLS